MYAQIAQKHWQTHLPNRYAALPNPDGFFQMLGQQVLDEIEDRAEELAGTAPPDEPYLDALSRLATARRTATEDVVRELIFLEPEPETIDPDERPMPEPTPGEPTPDRWVPFDPVTGTPER